MLNELAKVIYQAAKEKGLHDNDPVAFGDAMSNIHCEISEAYEEYRNKKPIFYFIRDTSTFPQYENNYINETDFSKWNGEKPEGIASEFADIIIRVLDNCEMYGINIDEAVNIKMEYNKTRPWKHGGKVV